MSLRDKLKVESEYYQRIRRFFNDRDVLEVVTPLIRQATNPDPAIDSIQTVINIPGRGPWSGYLQTSPEFAMKELLAAGSGSIYQMCKAFRDYEEGRWHRSEFTMLEWYREGWSYHELMDEVSQLAESCFDFPKVKKQSYQETFMTVTDIDPHRCSPEVLVDYLKSLKKHARLPDSKKMTKDDWLHYVMMHEIEPTFAEGPPVLLYDYPASQAALAKVRQTSDVPVAERFELYYRGVELANGFQELNNESEQRGRFMSQNEQRASMSKQVIPLDETFLNAVGKLPDCSGVAIGIDRMIALAEGQSGLLTPSQPFSV